MLQDWQNNQFILTFVPLFIAIDAFGNLPFLIFLSGGLTVSERRRIVHLATLTAAVVGLAFLFFGQFILTVMGISVGSFAIAGGIVLLVLSIKYMSTGQMVEMVKEEMVAVVPIGTPLIAGPATVTTLLLLIMQFPVYIVLAAFMANLLISWGVFMLSDQIVRFMGQGGLKAISKVFSLLLSAIAVTMILRGLDLVGLVQTG